MNPETWVKLIVAAALIATGAAVGAGLTAKVYKPKLETARADLATCKANHKTLSDSVDRQNVAIRQIEEEGKAKATAAAKEVKQARAAAVVDYTKAGQVLGVQLPAGADRCSFARDLFDIELREERGTTK